LFIILVAALSGGIEAEQRKPGQPSARREAKAEAAEKQARADAEHHFEVGQKAHEEGRLQEAIEQYTTALSLIPDFPEALYQRAAASLALGRVEDGWRDLSRLTELEPSLMPDAELADPSVRSFFARVHDLLAVLLLKRQEAMKAEEHLHKAIALDPKFQRARINLASLLIARKSFESAITQLKAASELGEPTSTLLSLLAYAHEQMGQTEAAFEAYSKAIELDPDDALAREGRGRILIERKEYNRAIEDLNAAYRSRGSAQTALRLIDLYTLTGKIEEALTLCQKLIASDPKNRQAREILIKLLVKAQRLEEAQTEARRLAESYPEDPVVMAHLGELLLQSDPAEAAMAYTRALERDPQNIGYRVNLGAALLKTKRFAEAIQNLSLVIEREPENHHAHAGLGTAYFELKEYAQAAREFNWIVQRTPELAIAHYFLALCYDRLMQYERALSAYEKFLSLANPAKNQAEMDNAKFRIPLLRRQIEEGKKRKKR